MKYESIHDVPRGFLRINGAPLTLDQINALITEVEEASQEDGSDFAKNLGLAKQRFRDSHDMVEGHWVAGGDA